MFSCVEAGLDFLKMFIHFCVKFSVSIKQVY